MFFPAVRESSEGSLCYDINMTQRGARWHAWSQEVSVGPLDRLEERIIDNREIRLTGLSRRGCRWLFSWSGFILVLSICRSAARLGANVRNRTPAQKREA